MQRIKEYFETNKERPLCPSSVRQYTRALLLVARKMGHVLLDTPEDQLFAITDYDKIKTYLDTLSLSNRQNKSMILSRYIPFLGLNKQEEEQYVRLYLDISKEAKTPNARPKPYHGPVDAIRYRVKAVPVTLPLVDNKKRVEHKKWPIDPNCMLQIDTLTRAMKDFVGNKLLSAPKYRNLILRLMKIFKQKTLDFLISNVDDIIAWFNTFSLEKVNTPRSYFAPIVRYLYIANPIEEQDYAYRKYLQWVQKLPQSPAAKFRYEQYKGYHSWPELKKQVEKIIESDKTDPLHKMLLALYTDIPPRRSKDFTFMKVNVEDDKTHNILQLHDPPEQSRFIFNSYKTVVKSLPQRVTIQNPVLVERLKQYIQKRKKQPFLLMNRGKILNKDDIQKIMRDTIGKKYNIPSGIRTLRHLYTTYIVMDKNFNPQHFARVAYEMGTSDRMLIQRYATFDLHQLDTMTLQQRQAFLQKTIKDIRAKIRKEDDEEFKNKLKEQDPATDTDDEDEDQVQVPARVDIDNVIDDGENYDDLDDEEYKPKQTKKTRGRPPAPPKKRGRPQKNT